MAWFCGDTDKVNAKSNIKHLPQLHRVTSSGHAMSNRWKADNFQMTSEKVNRWHNIYIIYDIHCHSWWEKNDVTV